MKSHLFLCGVPRSGTTALTDLLSGHTSAAIGIERYKKYVNIRRVHQLTPDVFERERFFTFDDSETNLGPERASSFAKHYADLDERFDDATVVGDKVPTYYYIYHHLLGTFPNCKVVCILRNPFEVASSWNRRAKNSADRWAPEEDARRALLRWNEALMICERALVQFPQDFLIVEHARLFGGDVTYFEWLSREVGLPAGSADMERYNEACAGWQAAKDKPLDLDETERRVIVARANFALYERLTGTAIQPPVASS